MAIDDDINEFKDWALSLGFPFEDIPSNNVLHRLFSSGQSLTFNELMQRVRPMQEVKKIRDAIAVQKIESNTKNIAVASKFQSKEMQRYQQVKKLEEKLADIKKKNALKAASYKTKTTDLRENNLRKLHLKRNNADILSEVSIYKLRLAEMRQLKQKEIEAGERINKATPIDINMNNCDVKAAVSALVGATLILTEHYTNMNANARYEVASKAHDNLWNKLRQMLTNLPNFILWGQLNKQMEKNSLALKMLAKLDLTKVLKSDSTNDSMHMSEIAKLQAEHIKLVINANAIDGHDERLSNEFVVCYEQFLSHLRTKFAMYNDRDVSEETLADYISQWTTLRFGQGEIEYLRKTIDENEVEIQGIRQSIDGNKASHTTLMDMYDEIQEKYCSTQDDLISLSQVKEKILHSKNLLRYLLQCKSDQKSIMCQQTFMSNESACIGDGHSMDYDGFSTNVTQRADSTCLRPMTSMVPLHVNELSAVFTIPFGKLKSHTLLAKNRNLQLSPIIDGYIFDDIPKDAESLLLENLIAPSRALEQMHHDISFHKHLIPFLNGKTIRSTIPTVDQRSLFISQRQHEDELGFLMEQIRCKCLGAHQQINMVKRYLTYCEENPLARFIPRSRLYNGKSFIEYEGEFLMYYNMVRNARNEQW